MRSLSIACVQNNPGPSLQQNIEEALALADEAAKAGAQLISLPEYFSDFDVDAEGRLVFTPYSEAAHPALPVFQELAKRRQVAINLGSLPIEAAGGKAFNRGYMIDAKGEIAARYNKIHMFDVWLSEGESYLESATVAAGDRACLVELLGARIGVTICYDLRFPELYRRLGQAGAELLLIPAAFTRTTGQAHWHLLVRARAVETGCFVAAASQCGDHPSGSGAYGHSLIVNPWGETLADGGETPGFILREIDLDEVDAARRRIPAWKTARDYPLDEAAK